MRRKAGGRRRSWFLQQWLSAREMFRRRRAGYVLMLTAFLIPVVLAAVNYTLKLIERSHSSLIKTSSSTAVGQAVLLAYNPAKKWSDQKAKVYSAGAQALNDRAFNLKKSMTFTAVPTTVFVASSPKNVSGFTLVKMYLALSSYGLTHLNNSNTHFHQHTTFADKPVTEDDKYKTLLCDDAPLDAISFNPNGTLSFSINSVLDSGTKYKEIFYDPALKINTDILETSLDTANNFIKCHCKSLGKAAKAYPAKCDVDIILTIPTNHAACTSDNSNTGALIAPNGTSSTPIVEIARSYAHFLRENFLHTIGVAVGVVPYSAKISVPPDRSDWTVNILPLSKAPSKPYIKQAVAYGTDGEEGGEIVNSSVQYEWGEATIGFPIMFRRGTRSAGYRDVNINEGILLSVDSPSSDANKFQRMNTNPCYLGHCNLLALACEKTCPTYMANPYFITELTDDVQKVIYDLGLLRPINDTKNKSNFLFLAVQWAHNLLSSWTNHPASSALTGEKFTHTARASKKHAVIIIVNAPDHFEHGELTYLGFSNDNSEIPMYESDMIPFSEGITVGGKGIIRYSGAGAYDSDSKSFEIAGADKEGTLTFPEKGVIKLVVALANPSITFYDDNKVDSYSNNGTTYAPSSSGTKHDLSSEQTFEFSGPTRLYDLSHNSKNIYEVSSTGGENFGHNLSIYKLKYKLKSAEITSGTLKNQILRAYAHYNLNGVDSSAKAIITSSTSSGDRAGAVQNAEHEKYIDPCIDLNDGCHNETTGWIFSGGNNCQVKAYNFHPKCHGVTNGKFVMTASWGGSPQVDNALVRCKNSSGSESWPLIGAIINGNVYNVFNFHPSGYSAYTDGVTQVFTGRFSAKSKETFRLTGSSTFKCRVWSRKADPGKNTYQQNVCSDSYGNAISVRYDCTSGSSTWCLCSDCGAHNYYPAGGWSYDNVENEYTYSNKNLEHIDGTATKATFYPGTTSSCYKTYDENGNETDSNCDRMTGAGCSYETSGEWTGGDVQDCNPNVEWSETPYEIEYEHCIRYDLNNFFFVNNDSKSYNAAATKTDIVQNKCIGKLDNNG
ncbi:MAG: hypothetical protein LBT63_00855, partial [Holosporaceae bacterium]|nr:hypothetical protein [Holosporaceae bacterium]